MPDRFELQRFAVPAVTLLVAFLAYSSQILFLHLEPGPLSWEQQWKFNALVSCIWLTYYRAITVNPGHVPEGSSTSTGDGAHDVHDDVSHGRHRFCRKCEAVKPPRSHHCKVCKRCIPRMDHHCPWTSNCVSHFTLPHFMRFLFYAVTAMIYLASFLWTRGAAVWRSRNLPSYLGPSVGQLGLLFVLLVVNSLTLFAVGVMLLRSAYDLGCNTTTIETWEIERHEQLLRRARVLGGYLDGPDGVRVRIIRHEFPYDIGVWGNICQGMGTRNVLAWFWPLSATPTTDGLTFPTNGFEDPGTSWPPPDPDRMPRLRREFRPDAAFTYGDGQSTTPDQELDSFRRRQQMDNRARDRQDHVARRKPFHARFDPQTNQALEEIDLEGEYASGEEGWQDSGGSRLRDYGVDEDTEFYDQEDDIPLSELIRRRRSAPTK